jgi:hypothetical protein
MTRRSACGGEGSTKGKAVAGIHPSCVRRTYECNVSESIVYNGADDTNMMMRMLVCATQMFAREVE